MPEIIGHRTFKTPELEATLKLLDEDDLTELAETQRKFKGVMNSGLHYRVDITIAERNNILRLLALGWVNQEIIQELNRNREREGRNLLLKDFSVDQYKRKYGKAIEVLRKKFNKDIIKVCRFTDKFIRLRTLNDIAESILENSNRINERLRLSDGSQQEDDPHSRKERVEDTRLLLKVFDSIHKEMGVTKYVIKEKKDKKDIPETLEDKIKAYSLRLAQPVDFQIEKEVEKDEGFFNPSEEEEDG